MNKDTSSIPQVLSSRLDSILLALPVCGFLTFNVIALLYLLQGFSFRWIHHTYLFNTWYFPIFLLLYSLLVLCIDTNICSTPLIRWTWRSGFLFSLFMLSIFVYATYLEPRNLHIRHVTIHSEKILEPLTIVHLSDTQCNVVDDYVEEVFKAIQEVEPDLVLHTGDLLQPLPPYTFETEIPKMAALIRSLPCPVYGVYGDTDGWLYANTPVEMGGYQILNSTSTVLELNNNRINVHGMELWESDRGAPDRIERWIEQAGAGDFLILLGHRPDYILKSHHQPIDLCLAGHTHGGQIRIPGFGPIVTLSAVPRDWALGFREVGQTRLNVSAGVGCEHADGLPDIRIFCPPEFTVFHLQPMLRMTEAATST
ncbi:MAG: metallophosphoesterase [bacterium]